MGCCMSPSAPRGGFSSGSQGCWGRGPALISLMFICSLKCSSSCLCWFQLWISDTPEIIPQCACFGFCCTEPWSESFVQEEIKVNFLKAKINMVMILEDIIWLDKCSQGNDGSRILKAAIYRQNGRIVCGMVKQKCEDKTPGGTYSFISDDTLLS